MYVLKLTQYLIFIYCAAILICANSIVCYSFKIYFNSDKLLIRIQQKVIKVIYGKINLIYQYFQNIRVSLFLYIKLLTVKTTV